MELSYSSHTLHLTAQDPKKRASEADHPVDARHTRTESDPSVATRGCGHLTPTTMATEIFSFDAPAVVGLGTLV